ncbi:MAG TPA: hypothetical protein VIJ51_12525, partial [Solirubrobacteraceae bacterium]
MPAGLASVITRVVRLMPFTHTEKIVRPDPSARSTRGESRIVTVWEAATVRLMLTCLRPRVARSVIEQAAIAWTLAAPVAVSVAVADGSRFAAGGPALAGGVGGGGGDVAGVTGGDVPGEIGG